MAHLVLAADDDRFRRSLARILDEAGYSVAEAATGNLAKVKSSRPQVDLLITDLHMPDMDGLQLLTEAKRTSCHCDVRLVQRPPVDLCRHLRRALAGKPFKRPALLEFVESALLTKASPALS